MMMERIRSRVEEIRQEYDILRDDYLPIDVLTFLEIDLGIDVIPMDDFLSKYGADAAITADLKGIYIDAEQYILINQAPEWRLKRLRFTVAHELGHFFLHPDVVQARCFTSLSEYKRWSNDYGGRKYELERDANEFAGRLLIPLPRIQEMFDTFTQSAIEVDSDFINNSQLRYKFCEKVAPRFGVNTQVIEARLSREDIWLIES